MIKPENKKWARLIFNPYEEFLLKRNFTNFYLAGDIPDLNPEKSLLITPNHFSWWDGFFIDFVSRKLFNRNFHILMLEKQLRKYSFFKNLGAFSIEPDDPRGIHESMKFTWKLLQDPANIVAFYPQGSIEPYDVQPLTVKPGLRHLLKNNTVSEILPAAFRIEYNNLKKPAVWMRFGKLLRPDEIPDFGDYCRWFRNTRDELNSDVNSGKFKMDLFGRTKQ